MLGGSRIGRGLKNDETPRGKMLGDGPTSVFNECEIGAVIADRSWHANDDDVRLLDRGRLAREREVAGGMGRMEGLRQNSSNCGNAAFELLEASVVNVVTGDSITVLSRRARE